MLHYLSYFHTIIFLTNRKGTRTGRDGGGVERRGNSGRIPDGD
uniref:Uncharacterized protein n=1 Tax=Arundo donax TaxID=35708 RepID=A0A0A8ZGP8_ARUDO